MSHPLRVRKRPVEVDAFQFTGDNAGEIVAWTGGRAYVDELRALVISTLEGDHIAVPGDMVIRGVEGEYYPVRPSVFDATYELV